MQDEADRFTKHVTRFRPRACKGEEVSSVLISVTILDVPRQRHHLLVPLGAEDTEQNGRE
jgi:hypothetical protein